MNTTVAGLLPSISKFVMVRSPTTFEEALDCARKASILQDASSDRVEVALTTLTDQIGNLQADLNRMKSTNREPLYSAPSRQEHTYFPPRPMHPRGTYDDQRPSQQQQFLPRSSSYSNQQSSNQQNRGNDPFRRQATPCRSCGGPHHRDTCRFRSAKCNHCQRLGHIASACLQKHRQQ